MPRAQYFGSVAADPAAQLLAESTWILFGDDALDSGGTVTNWVAQQGPNALPAGAPFGTPTVVTRSDLNNRKVVRFDRTSGQLLLVNGNVNPVVGDHTLLIFYWPEKAAYYSPTNAERSYITIVNNNGTQRFGLGVHTANDQRVTFSHRYRGFVNEGAVDGDTTPSVGWHNFTRSNGGFVFSVGGPQCAVIALSDPGNGGANYYIDGVLEGTSAFYITKRAFQRGSSGSGRHTIGAETLEVLPTGPTFFGGDIGCFIYWPRKLTTLEVQTVSASIMLYYGWGGRAYNLPTQFAPTQITGWWSSRRNLTCGIAEPTTVEWMDMLGRVPMLAGGTPVPVNGVAGFNGTNAEYTTTTAVSGFLAANGGTIAGRLNTSAISTNSASPWLNVVVLADESGFVGSHLRNNAGTPQLIAYLNDSGGVKTKVSTIALNAELTHIMQYNGATLRQWINGVENGVGLAALNVTNLTFGARIGGKSANNIQQYAGIMAELLTFNVPLTDPLIAELNTYLNVQVP